MAWTETQLALRRRVWDRSDGRCQLCGEPVPFEQMHMDHIIPRIKGGLNTEDNLRAAHRRCNISRGAKAEWKPADFRNIPRAPMPELAPHVSLWEAGLVIRQSRVLEILGISYQTLRRVLVEHHVRTYRNPVYSEQKGRVWISADDLLAAIESLLGPGDDPPFQESEDTVRILRRELREMVRQRQAPTT